MVYRYTVFRFVRGYRWYNVPYTVENIPARIKISPKLRYTVYIPFEDEDEDEDDYEDEDEKQAHD